MQSDDGERAIGVYEIYAKPGHTEAFITSRKRLIWFAILAVFATLYGALALLVRPIPRHREDRRPGQRPDQTRCTG